MKTQELIHEICNTGGIFGRHNETKVQFSGSGAYATRDTINLPALPEGGEISEESARVYRGYLDHEAGHVRHTDYDIAGPHIHKWMREEKEDLRYLNNAIEDMFIERKVLDEYPGAFKNIKEMTQYTDGDSHIELAKHPEKMKENTLYTAGLGILTEGRKGMGTASSNIDEVQALLSDNMRKFLPRWNELIQQAESTEDNIRLTYEIQRLLEQDPELESDPEDFLPDGIPEVGQEGDEPSEEDKKAAKEDKRNGNRPGEGKGKRGDKDKKGKAEEDPSNLFADKFQKALEGVNRSIDYSEVSGKPYVVVSTAYDKITKRGEREFDNSVSNRAYGNVRPRIAGSVSVMRSRLRRSLLAKERIDWDTGRLEGRIDTKRLVKAYQGTPEVYKKKQDRSEYNTAVQFLVDLSGSMGGQKANVTAECMLALSECLEGTAIKYNIMGFHNYGGDSEEGYKLPYFHRVEGLIMPTFKDWSDSLFQAKDAIASIPEFVGGNNSDYDAIMKAYFNLASRPEQRKVLFVLSDGYPANYIYNVREGDLLKKAREGVQWITNKKKIETLGLGICSDAVKHIYDDYVVVNNITDMAGTAFRKMTDILIGGREGRKRK